MLRRFWRERWWYLLLGVLATVLFGSMYVHFEVEDKDKPAWLASATEAVVDAFGEYVDWRSSMPDCDDSEAVRKVEEMARELVLGAMPYNIEQPFHLDNIELTAVAELETNDDVRRCRGHLAAPNLVVRGQQYQVGVIGYVIMDDETKAGWYMVEAQLESVNLIQWAD